MEHVWDELTAHVSCCNGGKMNLGNVIRLPGYKPIDLLQRSKYAIGAVTSLPWSGGDAAAADRRFQSVRRQWHLVIPAPTGRYVNYSRRPMLPTWLTRLVGAAGDLTLFRTVRLSPVFRGPSLIIPRPRRAAPGRDPSDVSPLLVCAESGPGVEATRAGGTDSWGGTVARRQRKTLATLRLFQIGRVSRWQHRCPHHTSLQTPSAA